MAVENDSNRDANQEADSKGLLDKKVYTESESGLGISDWYKLDHKFKIKLLLLPFENITFGLIA